MNFRFPLILAVAALAPAASAAPYVSPAGYRITPPAGWTTNLKEAADGHVYFDSPSTAEIGEFDSPLDSGETVAGDMAQLVASLKKHFPDFKLISQRAGTLGGVPDREMEATYTTGTKHLPLHFRQVIASHGGRMYGFSLTETRALFAQTNTLFDKSLRTVQWVRR